MDEQARPGFGLARAGGPGSSHAGLHGMACAWGAVVEDGVWGVACVVVMVMVKAMLGEGDWEGRGSGKREVGGEGEGGGERRKGRR